MSNEPLVDPVVDPNHYSMAQIAKARYVEYIFYPLLLTMCTFGNGISLFVLAHERPKGSTNTYLFVAAISDLFVLWLHLPDHIFHYLGGQVDILRTSGHIKLDKAYSQYYGLEKWGGATFSQLSNWTLLVFSFERLVAIFAPFAIRRTQTAFWARLTCGILLVLSAITNISYMVNYYGFGYADVGNRAERPLWLLTWEYIQFRASVIIPVTTFAALLITNTVIMIALFQRRKEKIGETGNVTSSEQSRNSNLLLMGSAALFLVTHLPITVHISLLIARDFGSYNYLSSSQLFVLPFVETCYYINYSANCYVYLLVSLRFRQQFLALLRRYGCRTVSNKLEQVDLI